MNTTGPLWIWRNIQLVSASLPHCPLRFDREEGKWLHLARFPMPSNILQKTTDILLMLPGIHAPITEPPAAVYLDQNLRSVSGNGLAHLFDHGASHGRESLSHMGYAWFCLLFAGWHPASDVVHGDNYLTALNTVYRQLSVL